ncbi:coiled-coil domain-containing protein AGAP005037 isoform X6 [Ischnura elegans]|uniref:coiled-coil domain-containing protein AGAP005037 isoform X6 n=1 Tax=Ischnura elegans TaxID=197161 RepID=UPI001ED8AAC7|nr:coiled-coil domain-containing protein AGAP005037 isoform X6 [Ischnura elegans]
MSSKSQRRKHNNNNAKMSDPGDAFLARMRRRVPMTSTPIAGSPTPQQQQYVRHQQRPPHPPMNSLPGYGKTPLPRGSSGGSGNYYPPGMPTTGGGTHGTLDPRSVGHGAMMMGGGGMLYEEDDPGIMSEVETASTGFRRGGKQRSSLPVVRTPSKTLERPLGEGPYRGTEPQRLVFLQYRNETKRALLPNEITSIDTVKALFVRSFPKQLSMEYLDSPLVKIYIHDSSKDMFYELEDLRSHLRDIRDRSVLRLFESDVNGGPGGGVMPGGMVGVPVPGPSPAPVPLWDQDQSYFSEPEFDSEYHHQHIHKTKGSKSGPTAPSPYYMTHSYPPGSQPGGQPGVVVPPGGPASSATLPRGPLLRAYSPATERIKPMPPAGGGGRLQQLQPPPKPQRSHQQQQPCSQPPTLLLLPPSVQPSLSPPSLAVPKARSRSFPLAPSPTLSISPSLSPTTPSVRLPGSHLETTYLSPHGGRSRPPSAPGSSSPSPSFMSLPDHRDGPYSSQDRMHGESGYMSSPERGRPYPPYPSPSPAVPPVGPPTGGGPPGVAPPYEDPYFGQYGATRSGSITPVIDEEASDTEMMDNSYSLYGGVKMAAGRPIAPPQSRQFPPTATMPAAAVPYDATRIRVEHMERQLANLTGLVQKALTQGRPPPGGTAGAAPTAQPGVPDGTPPGNYLQVPASRDAYRNADEYDKHSSSSSASLPDKSVSFEKSVSFSDEPPDMSSPKQHSPQHAADTKPPKPAIKSSTLPRTSSQERDHRHKPAPPPKPVSLSPGQYEGRHIYRDLHLTPEMYNQLRVLQRKAKDLRQEVRNLRRMSQAQAHSVRETIRDTFIKIRAMLLTGGESWLHQQQIADTDRVRVSREEELYKQEMLRLEKDLTELESTVEELRGNVINRKTRVNMSDVENMALILSKSSKTVADLKVRFPNLQDGMKSILSSEMEKVVREEKFLKEEPERLESALRRCKKLTGTLVTLKRLASVQEQRLPPGNSSIDARLSPTLNDSPPIPGVVNERGGSVSSSLGSPVSGSPGPNSKPATISTGGVMAAKPGGGGGGGGGNPGAQGGQRPESALDALLDELQTFSRPSSRSGSRKGSMDGGGQASGSTTPPNNACNSSQNSGQGTLRRLHSYPSSDSMGSPVKTAPQTVARLQVGGDGIPIPDGGGSDGPGGGGKLSPKPPVPERSSDLLARRVPPPPPPRTSSRSPLVSPTSPPNHPAMQHRPQPPLPSQSSTSSSTSSHSSSSAASSSSSSSGPPATLPRCMPRRSLTPTRSGMREPPGDPAAAAAAALAEEEEALALEEEERKRRAGRREHLSSNSSSSESVNSQEGLQQRKGSGGSGGSGGSSKARQEALEQRHRELLRKQRQLQEQYARLQQLQRGGGAAPGYPGFTGPQVGDLKKTGSESNLLARMGHLSLSAAPATHGSLTHLAPPNSNPIQPGDSLRDAGANPTNAADAPTAVSTAPPSSTSNVPSAAATPAAPSAGKIYETDIL